MRFISESWKFEASRACVRAASHQLGPLDHRPHVLGKQPQDVLVMLLERHRIVDPVHVEHPHAAVPDAQRKRKRRGDVALTLEMLAEVLVRLVRPKQHALLTLRHPAGDALAHPHAAVAAELGFEAIGGAGLEHPGLRIVDHDRRLLGVQGRDHAAYDDLEDGVEPELQVECRRHAEQGRDLGQACTHVLVLALLALERSANLVELVLFEHQVQAEHDDQPGQPDSGVVPVADPLIVRVVDVEQRHVEDRDGHGHGDQHRERDGPQPPVVAVDAGKR